jgi:hypothetical protein
MPFLRKPVVNYLLNAPSAGSALDITGSGSQPETSQLVTAESAEPFVHAAAYVTPLAPSSETPQSRALTALLATTTQQSHSNDGFDQLEGGYGAFPMVKLEGGDIFRINGDLLGTEVSVAMIRVRSLYLWKDRESADDSLARLAWSYDNLTSTREENLKEIVTKWQEEGYQPVMRRYAEVLAEIMDGVWSGQLVILSISPQSVPRLFAYRETLQLQRHLQIPQVITRIFVGEPIKSRGISFRPWAFEFLREVQ